MLTCKALGIDMISTCLNNFTVSHKFSVAMTTSRTLVLASNALGMFDYVMKFFYKL